MNGFSRYLLSTLLLVLAGIAAAEIETVTWLHTDHLGSPLMARDAQGNTLWQEDYSPWGERLAAPSANSADIGYTGHYEEADIGLIYAQARWYDPAVGRFLSADAVGFGAGGARHFGRYDYGDLNPYLYADPDGRDAVRLGIEGSPPLVAEVAVIIAHATGIIPADKPIPQGFSAGVVLTFPGAVNGEWGVGVSIDAVFGAEVSLETNTLKGIDWDAAAKKWGHNYEGDWIFPASVPSDVTQEIGLNEVGGMAGRIGGQVSYDAEGNVAGAGLKYGAGIGFGSNVNVPIFGWETK